MAVARKVETGSFVQTEVGLLPSDWHLSTILNMSTSVSSGRSHVDCDYGGVPVYGSTGIIGRCHKGDYLGASILIARVGANAGKLAVVDGAYGVTDNTIIVKIKDSFELQYIWRQLDVKKLNSLVFGSGQPLLTGTQIKNLVIPLPPTKAEQESIATALSDADALIESLEQLIAKKRLIQQGAMQELLTGKRRLPGFGSKLGYQKTELGLIPKDWSVISIGELCNISAGRDLVKSGFSSAHDESYPYPVYSNSLSDLGLYGYSKVWQYDLDRITVTARGGIGHAVYRNKKFCAIGRLLVLSAKQPCDLRFVTDFINNYVDFALESTGVPQLTAPQISKYSVALPVDINEQKAISSILDSLEKEIHNIELKLTKARQLKQGMMQELLTGRIRLI